MTLDGLSKDTISLLNLPPVEWRHRVEAMLDHEKQRVERELDSLVQQGARLIGYLEGRGTTGSGDQGHDEAVESSNERVAKVRKALGYLKGSADISF